MNKELYEMLGFLIFVFGVILVGGFIWAFIYAAVKSDKSRGDYD